MPNKSPAFQFYPDDWLSCEKVACMTPAQEGAYIRLLCYMWRTDDCSLPDDDAKLAVLSRLNEGWFNGGSTVVRECFQVNGTKLYHKRLLAEREKQREWREKSAAGGKASAKARKLNKLSTDKGGSTKPARVVQPNGNSPSPSPSPSINPPNPPEGGDGVAKKKRKRGLTVAQKKRMKVAQNTQNMILIGGWFGRKPSTLWTVYEADAISEIEPINEEELAALKGYYEYDHKPDHDIRRRAIEQLLNNWSTEIDRARTFRSNEKQDPSELF